MGMLSKKSSEVRDKISLDCIFRARSSAEGTVINVASAFQIMPNSASSSLIKSIKLPFMAYSSFGKESQFPHLQQSTRDWWHMQCRENASFLMDRAIISPSSEQ